MSIEKLNKSPTVRISSDQKNSNNKYFKIMMNGCIYDYNSDVELNYFETRKYELLFTVLTIHIYQTTIEWNSANQCSRIVIFFFLYEHLYKNMRFLLQLGLKIENWFWFWKYNF